MPIGKVWNSFSMSERWMSQGYEVEYLCFGIGWEGWSYNNSSAFLPMKEDTVTLDLGKGKHRLD